jgi:hypothetical protein
MIEAVELTRNLRAAVWLLVLLWLAGSTWRSLCGTRRADDALWALFWFNGVAVLGYNARWLFGIAGPMTGDLDLQTRFALNVLLTLIGVGIMWKRIKREGWRW